MKALVLVVFLALLIASVSVSCCIEFSKQKTAPTFASSISGGTAEQDETVVFTTPLIISAQTGFAGQKLVEKTTSNTSEGASPTQGGSNEQGVMYGPLVYEETYGWNTRNSEPLGTVVDQVGQAEESVSGAYSGIIRGYAFPPDDDRSSEATFGQPEIVSELAPSTIVYVGGTTIPLSTYQTKSGKYLWIESNGLHQYMFIPQYSSLPLMAYTSTGGPGEILEMYPSTSSQGTYQKVYYNFNPGYNRIPYRGDVLGRHYLLFSMGDQSSNAIIIDVNNGMIGDSPVLGTMPS
jgi:hypothetical protein